MEELGVELGEPKIEICYVNGGFFARKTDADRLEKTARVCVNRTGHQNDEKKKTWHFNSNLCPILAELVAVLLEFGLVEVFRTEVGDVGIQKTSLRHEDVPFENSAAFRTRRLAVRDFWKRGFFVADGSRFGGHFLIYTSSPNECHAKYVLLCSPCTDEERIAALRCCNQVKKTLILATSTVSDASRPHYTKCEWFRPELEKL